MKILSLNVRHGGGQRISSICEYVQSQGPDVFIATEHRNRTKLADQLAELGYASQVSGSGDKNTVLIASKHDGDPVIHESQRLIGIRLDSMTVLGTYFAQNNEKRPLFDYLLANPPVEPSLLIGDFNTGEHFKDENKKTFYCADLFVRLVDVGWLRLNSHEPSWYSTAGNGFCIDHAFVSAGLTGKASFDHSTRESGLTDHSGLLVEIG